jgi:hypothetical protein
VFVPGGHITEMTKDETSEINNEMKFYCLLYRGERVESKDLLFEIVV